MKKTCHNKQGHTSDDGLYSF